jgi:hypothetical protein
MKKLIFVLIFTSIANAVFSEMTFTLNAGLNLLDETYKDDVEYKRSMPGFSGQFRFDFYGKNSVIGFFVHDEFGLYFNDDERIKPFIGSYASIAIGPSFIIRTPTNKIFLSLSLGPIIQWYSESYYINEGFYLGDKKISKAYNAFDFGGYGDLAIVFKTNGSFLFRLGVASEVFFARGEIGYPVRNPYNEKFFDDVSYLGIVIKPHIGIGLGYLFN